MKTKYLLFALPLIALMTGCTDLEEDVVGSPMSGDIKSVTISLPEYDNSSVADTRTEITYGGQITFAWAENDTVGIFPVGGGQVEFPISSAAGTTHASFNGGKWALRASEKYAAYFPYNKANVYRDSEHILMDFTGQVQKGVNSTKHMGQYDFLGSPAVNADSEGNLNFQLQRFMKPMDFRLTFPEAVQVKTVRVMADEPIFITQQTMDISGDNPVITTVEESMSRELLLKVEPADGEETVDAVETGDFYLAMGIQDLTPYQLRIQVTTTDNRFFSSDIVSKDLTNSFPGYRTTATLSEGADFIEFADPEVERICLENWDTNGDGKLSYKEAASVSTLGTVFKYPSWEISQSPIKSFDEFQYFTGVKSLDNGEFFGCNSLTSITIPESVTSITNAFSGCYSLSSIIIPKNVTTIEYQAFNFCKSLMHISVDSKNAVYDSRDNCNAIIETATNTLVVGCIGTIIPSSIITIGDQAFFRCPFYSITIPEGVTTIGNSTFADSPLRTVFLPNSLETIGNAAFSGCDLRTIVIPEGVKSIGGGAFSSAKLKSIIVDIGNSYYYSYEESILIETSTNKLLQGTNQAQATIPEGVTIIGDGAFGECDLISSVNLPNSVTTIGNNAFSGCTSLTSITLPDGVTSIGNNAFNGCTSLTSITLPDGVTNIGMGAFSFCYNLTSINLPSSIKSIEDYTFDVCASLTSITLPDGLESIGDYAFRGCPLVTITIPASVTSIGRSAFYCAQPRIFSSGTGAGWGSGANTLTSIIFLATTPPDIIIPYSFSFDPDRDPTIYVPITSVNAYKAAWPDYSDCIVEIGAGGEMPGGGGIG